MIHNEHELEVALKALFRHIKSREAALERLGLTRHQSNN